ncbi:MAG: bifunctional hydroxymethylpyrimidine kinase/phosphomethylpyrimidine kinase [Solirubrobacteraceae bacterium]
MPTRVLSIAGSDSGGGAGLQADARAFARLGVYGTFALTAVTAQNTTGVVAVHNVPAATVVAQIDAVLADIGIDGLKVGMLGTHAVVEAVAGSLGKLAGAVPVVVDPVLAASAGGALLDADAVDALRRLIMPHATVATPNIGEAQTLSGRDTRDPQELARAVHALGCGWVLVTGGHGPGLVDVLYDGETVHRIDGTREDSPATHGSGCTHSAALAALLALGERPLTAARNAQTLVGEAIRHGVPGLGAGEGPVWLRRDS